MNPPPPPPVQFFYPGLALEPFQECFDCSKNLPASESPLKCPACREVLVIAWLMPHLAKELGESGLLRGRVPDQQPALVAAQAVDTITEAMQPFFKGEVKRAGLSAEVRLETLTAYQAVITQHLAHLNSLAEGIKKELGAASG